MRPVPDCVFCKIVAGDAEAEIVEQYSHSLVIVPINPVVPGHVLVIPYDHSPHFAAFCTIAADTMYDAAYHAANTEGYENCNLITSRGRAATQTVMHLHIHLVPRREGDGLHLPWTGQ